MDMFSRRGGTGERIWDRRREDKESCRAAAVRGVAFRRIK